MPGTVTLAKGATVITVPGPGPGGTQVVAPTQFVTGMTVGGTRYGYKASASIRELWTVALTSVNAANKAALQTFFYTVVGGPGVVFSYTHTDGTVYSAMFVAGGMRWQRRNSREWDVTLILDVPGQVQ